MKTKEKLSDKETDFIKNLNNRVLTELKKKYGSVEIYIKEHKNITKQSFYQNLRNGNMRIYALATLCYENDFPFMELLNESYCNAYKIKYIYAENEGKNDIDNINSIIKNILLRIELLEKKTKKIS